MKQIISSLLVAGLIFMLSPSVVKGQKPKSVLWKVSGKNLKHSSYLLGTFHNAPYQLFASFPELKTFMSKCEFGIFEKDENPIGKVENATIVTPPLDSIFTPKEYALVDSFFTNSSFGSIRPHNKDASPGAMLQVVLMLKQQQTKKQEMQFDDYIYHFIRDSLQRKTFGLDETGQMARDAAKTNYREVAKAIIYLISHDVNTYDLIPKDIFDLNLYATSLKSDMKLNKELSSTGAELKISELTIERNQLWLPKIALKMNEGACFIAVGLGHLHYQTGLIQLLRREGYTLTPVRLKKRRLS